MAIFLGFYLGHDTNVAVSINGKIKYRKSERFFGSKHHKANFQFILNTLKDWKIDPGDIDCCAYSDGNRNKLGQCEKKDFFCAGLLKELKSFCLDHHFAHILSSWPVVDIENVDYGISIDGRGDHNRSLRIIKNPAKNPELIYEEYGLRMGYEFYQIGELLKFSGLEYDFAGKLMGLQSYSEKEITKFGLPSLEKLDTSKLISRIEGGIYKTFFEWHEYWWDCTEKIFDKFFNRNDNIAYVGGCAQNTVYNYRLKKMFPNLSIPPHCYDGGISLGCLEFLRIMFDSEKFEKNNFPYWQDDDLNEKVKEKTIKKAAKMLAEGKIIGWSQGSGELGPRALGNRSILMNAELAENKNIINNKIKKREAWRPYAGSVLEDDAKDYFDMEQSKYMLYACKVKNKNIPAITHVDNSCRMQTVNYKDNPVFFELLNEYRNLTGVPVILNTSLNVMGKPIASSKNQIFELRKSNLDALFCGNKIVTNKIL